MSNNILLSIIVPVFGVEKYIERCARSLFEQTAKDIEIIFVDDCSMDKSMSILDEVIKDYPEREENIVILHHETNKGLPKARQTGLMAARGVWIAHCDSDDFVERNMFEEMCKIGERDNSDIVISDYFVDTEYGGVVNRGARTINRADLIHDLFRQNISWAVWNKIYRKSLYNKSSIIWPRNTHAEDMAMTLQLFYLAERFSYISKPFYHYNNGTITCTHSQDETAILKRYKSAIDNVNIVESFFEQIGDNSRMIRNGLINIKISQRAKLLELVKEDKYYQEWKSIFPGLNKAILLSFGVPIKSKVKFLLLYFRILP